MSGVERVLGMARLIPEGDPLPRALHGDHWVDGEVLLTIEDTDTGYPMGQITVTYAEMAAFAAIVAELAEIGVIADE